jgi:hypothetical protein
MPVDPDLQESVYNHIRKIIARLEAELLPFEAGEQFTAQRVPGGDWADTTQAHIDEIKREIAGHEAFLARKGQ